MTDAGMPIPALVLWMPMPNYADNMMLSLRDLVNTGQYKVLEPLPMLPVSTRGDQWAVGPFDQLPGKLFDIS
jgi:hypothetical protein